MDKIGASLAHIRTQTEGYVRLSQDGENLEVHGSEKFADKDVKAFRNLSPEENIKVREKFLDYIGKTYSPSVGEYAAKLMTTDHTTPLAVSDVNKVLDHASTAASQRQKDAVQKDVAQTQWEKELVNLDVIHDASVKG